MSMGTAVQLEREPLVTGGKSYADVTRDVCRPLESAPTKAWFKAFGVALTVLAMGLTGWGISVYQGLGVWGLQNSNAWGSDIINFVFWIGIGHAGTLISAVLFLFRQNWRTGINRAAEAMTIFAVICAVMYPLGHTGRPWLATYWLLPYPNNMGPLWVNFRSPLLWDVFAVSTYGTISAVFWFVGLIPDLATVRDRSTGIRRKIYGVASLGWRGAARHWSNYEKAYGILAGLSTPLVLSVHTIVSFDFAVANLPGWHTTIFPPYFVIGAIFSGFAMVTTLMVMTREIFQLKNYITLNHLEAMNKITMTTGMLVGLAYATEFFVAWYSGNPYEQYAFLNRAFGPYAWAYWTMITCNSIIPQVFWFRSIRRSVPVMFVVSIFVNIGMWFERFVIVSTSLHRDFLPSSWDYYLLSPTDWIIAFGSFGLFFTLYLLFCRFLPVVAIAEVKSVMKMGGSHGHH
ncbi:MAG: polysulfide reductase NrfD [Bdellovibrionales bacterium]|nr:polysulfide reductase NrfD [Bdellovibrionales bacterium]